MDIKNKQTNKQTNNNNSNNKQTKQQQQQQQKTRYKKLIIHVESHRNAVSLLEGGEKRYVKAINKAWSMLQHFIVPVGKFVRQK